MKTNILKHIILFLAAYIFTSCSNNTTTGEEAHHHEDEGVVELTEAQFQNAGIQFGKIETKNVSSTLQVNGMLDAPPQNVVSVSAMMGGFIKSTELLQGMKVKKGQVIATIQNPDFIEIQREYLENTSKLKFVEQEYKRQEELSKENVAATKTFQQVSSEYNSLMATIGALEERLKILNINPSTLTQASIRSVVSIFSPIDGYVTTLNVNLGKFVNPQDVICEIVNTHHLHVELTVFEKDIPKIQPGQKIRFVLSNEGSQERTGTIYLINRLISAERTVRVHAHLDKDDPALMPNMYVSALIEVTDAKTPVLPDEAIVSAGDKFYIFIKGEAEKHTEAEMNAEGKEEQEEEYAFNAIEVNKGISQNGYTEVILPANFNQDEVVVKGAYHLLAKMNNSEEEGHSH